MEFAIGGIAGAISALIMLITSLLFPDKRRSETADAYAKAIVTFTESISKLNDTVSKQNELLDKKDNRLDQVEASLRIKEREIARLTLVTERQDAELKAMRINEKQKNERISELENHVKALQKAGADKDQLIERLKGRVDALEAENSKLEKKLEATEPDRRNVAMALTAPERAIKGKPLEGLEALRQAVEAEKPVIEEQPGEGSG